MEEEIKKETEEKNNEKKYSKGTYVVLITIVVLLVVIIATIGYGVSNIGKQNTNTNINSMQNNISNNNCNEDSDYIYNEYPDLIKKPIIYIYPTRETEVDVKLGNPQYLSCTYPKYEESWKVVAKPNGDLIDQRTGRNLYALYWEGKNVPKNTNLEEGFCIKGEDTASFLEEKPLTISTDKVTKLFNINIIYFLLINLYSSWNLG